MKVSVSEARICFSRLVRAAESGKTVVITHHGRPVAHLVALPAQQEPALQSALKDHLLGGPRCDAFNTERDVQSGPSAF